MLLAGRVGAGQPNAGLGWELNAITAVVLGSAGKAFGRPDAGSTLVGVLLIAVTFNLLNLEGGLSPHWQGVLRGLFLVAAVVLQSRLGEVRRLTG